MNRFEFRDRQPTGPLVVVSKRGVLHRALAGLAGPVLHARCAGGKPFRGHVLTDAEAVEWATGHEAALCRYPWCFRQAVRALGLDPEVGHAARRVYRPHPRPRRPVAHEPDAIRPHESVSGWAWCSCGRIVVTMRRAHNPDNLWWKHKAGGRKAVA